MSNIIIRKLVINTAVLLLLLLAATSVVDAQAEQPIGDGDAIAFVTDGNTTWFAPLHLLQDLESATGLTASTDTLGAAVTLLPPASTGHAVRMEGGFPDALVSQDLASLGYVTTIAIDPPALAGATTAILILE